MNKSDLFSIDFRLFQGTPAWELAKAIEDEDTLEIYNILKTDRSILYTTDSVYNNNLFLIAVYNNKIESIKCILELGFKQESFINAKGETALLYATQFDHVDVDVLDILMKNSENPNIPTINKDMCLSPLIAAAQSSLLKVEVMLKYKVDVNQEIGDLKFNALQAALSVNNLDIFLLLLKNGADINKLVIKPFDSDLNYTVLEILQKKDYSIDSKLYKKRLEIYEFLKSHS